MEEKTIQKTITSQVQSMIQHFFPIKLKEEEQNRYLAYFLRVLSGRIYSNTIEDIQHLSTLIKKRISKLHAKSSETAKLSRFQILFDKLNDSKIIKRKWAILYSLYSLSEDSSGQAIMPSIIQESLGSKILQKIPSKFHEPMVVDSEEPRKVLAKEISTSAIVGPQKVNLFGNVSEDDVLRDLLYVFQGIDGKFISYSILDDTYTVSSSVSVGESARGIILELCELGWLYRKVIDYVQKHTDTLYAGQVVQSFCFAIQGELNEYFRLLAVLEQQLHDNPKASPENKLDLMKLYLWMQEPMERMKWLAIVCDTTQNLKGGALASTIQQHTYGGTSTLYKFLSRILQEVCAPLLNMIKQWMIHGDAHDLYGDFFVTVDPNVTEDKLWYDKFSMNIEQIPTFLTYDLAQKVYLSGKAINFIRKCCAESEWMVPGELQEPDIKNWSEIMENPGVIGEWIIKIYEATNSQLNTILFTKYKLLDHCESIRKYLLLAQGDMHQYLMDLIYDTLSKPAEQIYKYFLM